MRNACRAPSALGTVPQRHVTLRDHLDVLFPGIPEEQATLVVAEHQLPGLIDREQIDSAAAAGEVRVLQNAGAPPRAAGSTTG